MTKVNLYDGLFILNSDAFARNPDEVSGALESTITGLGGTISVSRLFDERKLAYSIDGNRRGSYWLIYFHLAADKLAELNRQISLNANVIRSLIVKQDPRLEEALVANAKADPSKAEAAPEATTDVYEDENDAAEE